LLVAIRADPRASKPQELPITVPKQASLATGTADVSQQRQGPPSRPQAAPRSYRPHDARPTPLLEGAVLVAFRADPRASKPQERLVAVPW
jgi:hypothetical protein